MKSFKQLDVMWIIARDLTRMNSKLDLLTPMWDVVPYTPRQLGPPLLIQTYYHTKGSPWILTPHVPFALFGGD